MHVGQVPHELKLIPTRSPAATFVTFAPTRSTTPAPSWPSTAGSGTGYHWSRTIRSVWQMPAAATFTSTSSGRSSSTSSVCTANGAPFASVTAAWISMSLPLSTGPCRRDDYSRLSADPSELRELWVKLRRAPARVAAQQVGQLLDVGVAG